MKFVDMDNINMYLHTHVYVYSVPRRKTNDIKLDNNHYTEHFHTITYTRMSKMYAYLVTLAGKSGPTPTNHPNSGFGDTGSPM
jgi:hypothetical protein